MSTKIHQYMMCRKPLWLNWRSHARCKGQTTQVYLQRKLEGIACTPTLSERLQDAQAFVESFGARVSAEEIVGMIREDRER